MVLSTYKWRLRHERQWSEFFCPGDWGIDKASKIAYKTLTSYLTSTSDYPDAQSKSILAAKSLYGNTSNEATQVANAWSAVGLPTISTTSSSFSSSSSSQTSATYTILNMPADAKVVWHGNSLVRTRNSGRNATLLASGNGEDWISATVQVNGRNYAVPGRAVISENNGSQEKEKAETRGYSIQFDSETNTLNFQSGDNQTRYTLRLYNSSGLFIQEAKSDGLIRWNLSTLEKNVYFIRVYNQNTGESSTEKIFKNN